MYHTHGIWRQTFQLLLLLLTTELLKFLVSDRNLHFNVRSLRTGPSPPKQSVDPPKQAVRAEGWES